MKATARPSKPRQTRPAAATASPEPAAPQTPADPHQAILQAALETLELEAMPATVEALARHCGPMVKGKAWPWERVRAYQLLHRLVCDRAAAARLAMAQQGET